MEVLSVLPAILFKLSLFLPSVYCCKTLPNFLISAPTILSTSVPL